MRKRFAIGAVFTLLIALLAIGGTAVAKNGPTNFRAHLSGSGEVPAVNTQAQGQAKFQLNKAGDALDYQLIVANIEDVVVAHIHCGPVDGSGPPVAFLYGPEFPVSPNGILAEGTIVEGDIIPRDDDVCPSSIADFDDLIAQMEAGNTYVNVHTAANPGGEIRGQIH